MSEQAGIKNILVVEDDQGIAEVLSDVLKEILSCEVLLARTPDEALKLVEARKPHVCLLDYNLPHMNGIELYDHMRTLEGLETLPALIMSANLPLQDIEKRKFGAIKKPFDLDDLLQTLARLLEGKRKYA